MKNEVFQQFAKYCLFLAVKLMSMSVITALYRGQTNSFVSAEDARLFGKAKDQDEVKKQLASHKAVERV